MKGAPLPPMNRSNTALVLHDMQNDFIKESLSRPEMGHCKTNESSYRSCAFIADPRYLYESGDGSRHGFSE